MGYMIWPKWKLKFKTHLRMNEDPSFVATLPKVTEYTSEERALIRVQFLPKPTSPNSAYSLFQAEHSSDVLKDVRSSDLADSDTATQLNNDPCMYWHKEANLRRDNSKADVYYHAPDGTRIRSMPEVSEVKRPDPTTNKTLTNPYICRSTDTSNCTRSPNNLQ